MATGFWARAVLCGAFLTATAQPAAAAVFSPSSFVLANGLQIIIAPNKVSPAVGVMLWIKAGSADETAGKTGLAHYLEHLMFRGTPSVPAGAFSAAIAARGGSDNAFTGTDATAYHEIIAPKDLGFVFLLEADRMANLALIPEIAAPELSVVLNERDERTDNKPEGIFAEKMRAALFPDSAYGRPVIGYRPDVEKLTAADAAAFYKRHYAPDQAVLVVSGAVDVGEVLRLASATFGRLPRAGGASAGRVAAADSVASDRVIVRDARVKQPSVTWEIRVPSVAESGPQKAAALDVAAELLAGGQAGALFEKLVRDKGVATDVDASADTLNRGPGSFSFAASPRPGVDPLLVESALKTELARIARKGFSEAEVKAAKTRLVRDATLARDSLMAPCHALGGAIASGYDLSVVEKWPDRVKAVTAKQVSEALHQLVAARLQVVGLLLPEQDMP